jgi:hypothetical protein
MAEGQNPEPESLSMSMPPFSAMPTAVGEAFRTLWQEIQNIHLTWMINRQLFGTSQERIDLLNRFGGVAFGVFERLLIRHVVLAIFRLLDPASQRGGRDQNLCLERLVDEVTADDAACGTNLTPVLAQIRNHMAPHADLRNKVGAHNDFHTLPTLYDGTSTVTAPSRALVETVLERIGTLMNIVQMNYGEGESGYYNTEMSEPGDGEALLQNLNELAIRIDNDPEPRWVRMQKYRRKI